MVTATKMQQMQTRQVVGVEIFSAGEWTDSGGQTVTWTTDNIDAMIAAFAAGQPSDGVPLKVGHTPDGFNKKVADALGVPIILTTGDGDGGRGQLRLGQVASLTRKDNKLIATFANVPVALADLIEGDQYHSVSVEMEKSDDGKYLMLTAVALLGSEAPAVENLKPVSDAAVYARRRWFSQAKPAASKDADEAGTLKTMFGKLIDRVFRTPDGEKHTVTNGEKHPVTKEFNAPKGEETKMTQAVAEKPTFAMSAEELSKIQEALGLPKDATFAQCLEAMSKVNTPATEHAKPTVEIITLQKQVVDLGKRLDEKDTYIKGLEHDKLVTQYTATTRTWVAIAGKPEELAVELTAIHEAAGKDAAEKVVASYQKANGIARASGLLANSGSARSANNGSETKDAFEEKTQKFADDNKISFNKALAQIAVSGTAEEKKEFAEYKERVKASLSQ